MRVDTLGQVLGMLDRDRFDYLVVGLLKIRELDQLNNLSKHQVLSLSLLDWLAHLGFDASQQERVHAFLPDDVSTLTSLVICDARYVTYHLPAPLNRVRQVFDLFSNELLDKLPEPAVTHFVCAAQELYKRVAAAARQIEGDQEDVDEAAVSAT